MLPESIDIAEPISLLSEGFNRLSATMTAPEPAKTAGFITPSDMTHGGRVPNTADNRRIIGLS